MDRDYEVFFQIRFRDLLDESLIYPGRPYPRRYVRILDEISFDRSNWRSDAKYFLLYNVIFILIDPIYHVRPEILLSYEFAKALEEDVAAVSNRAEEIAKKRGRKRVSSTSVSKALGELVDDLRTNQFRIWGGDE